MVNKVLIQQNNIVQAYTIQTFPGSDSLRIVQFNPQVGVGFSGSVVIEGSFAASPGNNDFTALATVTFTGHTENLSLEIVSGAPFIRARIAASQVGAIAVYGDSANRALQGSQGATPSTAVVDSPLSVSGSGNSFSINAAVVPSITSDDVIYANDFSQTITDVLDGTNGATGKQDKIGTGVITASEADLNVLTGTWLYGLTLADLQKLADINASTTELNRSVGVTSGIQGQLDVLTAAIPAGLSGMITTGATIDSFFDVGATVSVSDLNLFSSLTASSADLNVFTGTAGNFTSADMTKLGAITASAADLDRISGFTGSSTDLNKLAGMTAATVDLNAITALAGTGVTTTEFAFLTGLTENVQTALDNATSLTGLTASVSDLNTFTGIFAGTGAFPAQISSTEVSYLNGVTSNIQTQLNNRRDIGVPIGISEISGASITTTELNYLQGTNSNIQAQIDAIGVSAITPAGGTFTGPIFISNGSAAAPGLGIEAPNNDTGFYLFPADGMALSIAGSRFSSWDGADFVIGTGAGAGSPTLKGVGMGVTDPAYAFTMDTDTGVYWAGANSLGLGAGAEGMMTLDADNDVITLGGTVVNNNAINFVGVFAGEKVLGRADVLAGSVGGATGQTSLYVVPTGRSAIITKIYVRLTQVVSFSDGSLLRMNIGFGGSFDEIVDNTNNITVFNPGGYAFDTAAQVMPLGIGDNTFPAISGSSGADYQVLTAADELEADVTVVAGADEFDMEIIVMGHEF